MLEPMQLGIVNNPLRHPIVRVAVASKPSGVLMRCTATAASSVIALLVMAGCGSGASKLTGSLTLRDAFGQGSDMGRGQYPCVGTDGYDDIAQGSPVTIYDAAGAIVAKGSLGEAQPLDEAESCLFPFTVINVPHSDFYQVEVSQRGKVSFTTEQVDKGQVSLTLGG